VLKSMINFELKCMLNLFPEVTDKVEVLNKLDVCHDLILNSFKAHLTEEALNEIC